MALRRAVINATAARSGNTMGVDWRDQEIEKSIAILRSLPRGTSLQDACQLISKALGRRISDAMIRSALKGRGLGTPVSYLGGGTGERQVPSASPEVPVLQNVGRSKDVPTDRNALPPPPPIDSTQELDIPIQFDDSDSEQTAEHGRGNIYQSRGVSPFDSNSPLPPHLDARSGDTGLGDGKLRVIIPDSHGCYIDPKAATAFLEDLKLIDPDEIVFLGDHVDVSGMYSAHPPNYVKDLEYSYEADIASAEAFIDAVQKRAPRARGLYLEGNHEYHVERTVARTMQSARDAAAQLELQAPEKRLRLKERGIRYCRMAEMHDGLSIPGTVRLGKCFFTHGFTAAKFATSIHVVRYGANVVHGHTHRVQEYGTRTVASDAIGGWCPGTLALLQPLYRHTSPTEWRHGYAIQAVDNNGRFVHCNIPLVHGWSGFKMLMSRIRPTSMIGDV